MMYRYNETNRTAAAVQTVCMAFLALFFLAASLYSMTHPESISSPESQLSPAPEYAGLPQR